MNQFLAKIELISCLVAVAVSCGLFFFGCGRVEVPPVSASDSSTKATSLDVQGEPPVEKAASLPRLGDVAPFTLTNQSGDAFESRSLQGKVWVANFFFTQCAATCPRQSAALQQLQSLQAFKEGAVQFVSMTVQPEIDTPDVLTRYAREFEADLAHWHFLTGSRNDIWELSKKSFFLPVDEAPATESMPIFHSPKFILVDGAMKIRGFFDSQSPGSVRELRAAVKSVLGDSDSFVQGESDQVTEPDLSDLESGVQGAFKKSPKSNRTGELAHPIIYAPSKSRVLAPWMLDRGDRQRDTLAEFEVFHRFRFRDVLPDSGIDFVNQVVEDAGKNYTAAHYDHGNGVAIADVDGDGRYDLYFTNQIGANGLFRNLGGGRFENITKQAGVALADRISVTASFADVDNDGDADLYVTTVRHGNALFRNDGHGKFEDVTEAVGLAYTGHSSSAVFFDYDRDGWLDLYLTNVGKYTTDEIGVGNYFLARKDAFAGHLLPELTESSVLYRNDGGKQFVDVTEPMQLTDSSWSGAATPVDANDDGWIDLYVLDMQGHDEYFENDGGTRFVKKSRELFPKTSWGAMGVKVFDVENDGRFDIYVTDMHSDMSERVGVDGEKAKANMQWPESMLRTEGQSIWGNSLFQRQPDGSFTEASDRLNAENYWPWGLSVGDLNADGFEDAFVASSMNLPFRYGVNSVLLNNRGKKFLDSEFILGVEPRRNGTSTYWFTLDCDGPDRDHAYAKQSQITSGKVDVWGALGSRSSVIFDYDDDGDLDIITNDFHSAPMVLKSNLSEQKDIRYLKVKLVGRESNRDGLGAVVKVQAGDRSFFKVHDGQSGYLSQSSHVLYFGLGDARRVDSVTVQWPSGKTQVVPPTESLNRVLTIEESN